jgi:endogenous inhibitor of DNA gyrase (YacG/DUF329 family)
MQVTVRCPLCGKDTLFNISTARVMSTPVLTIDDQAPFDFTETDCPHCKKELSVQLTVELFE